MKVLESKEAIQHMIQNHTITIIIFTSPSCGVCVPLKNKLTDTLSPYPNIGLGSVDLTQVQDAMGSYQIYTAPIILVFVEAKEVKRYSAALSMSELKAVVVRYTALLS